MKRVRFHEDARAGLVHEVEFYTAINRTLGERFDRAVKAAVERSAGFPELGSPHFFGTRRAFPKKFPFSVVSLILQDDLFIVALAPDSRKPKYWEPRLS